MTGPILFEHFRPGEVMGEIVQPFDAAMARCSEAIFGPGDAAGRAQGAAIAVAMMMRGYLGVVTPRPPGNVHARQRFTLAAAPRVGESVRTVVRCVSKELRRERRYVVLAVQGTGDGGRAIYDGTLDLIWAA